MWIPGLCHTDLTKHAAHAARAAQQASDSASLAHTTQATCRRHKRQVATGILMHFQRDTSKRFRQLALASAVASVLLPAAFAADVASPPASSSATALVRAVDSVGIPVSDLERSVDFYTRVLTFHKEAEREVAGDTYEHLYGVFGLRLRMARLSLGHEHIELMEFLAPRGRPVPVDSRSNDRWFQHIAIIVSDMDQAYARLREFKVEHASSGPQRLPDWNPNAGGIRAFYFRDPDGNHLEILQFPAGKGASRWQDKTALFLGVDHTAIVVTDTDTSVAYYRDLLGLRIAGTSENYGTEQEHLNNVFGARLRITALRAADGPGIELLEYVAPRTGRSMPIDSQANDRWFWQVNLTTEDVPAVAAHLMRAHSSMVSNGVAATREKELGYTAGVIARDPDGHAALFEATP